MCKLVLTQLPHLLLFQLAEQPSLSLPLFPPEILLTVLLSFAKPGGGHEGFGLRIKHTNITDPTLNHLSNSRFCELPDRLTI